MASTHLGMKREDFCVTVTLIRSRLSVRASAAMVDGPLDQRLRLALRPQAPTVPFDASGAAGTASMPLRAARARKALISSRGIARRICGNDVATRRAMRLAFAGSSSQRAAHPAGSISRIFARQDLGRQEVVGDEAADGAADSLLVVRHDRRMRNRHAERMAKQARRPRTSRRRRRSFPPPRTPADRPATSIANSVT